MILESSHVPSGCSIQVFINIIALKQGKLWQGGLFQLQATEGLYF